MYTMTLDGATFYEPGTADYVLEAPTIKLEANKIGTLSFTIYPNHPLYGSIIMQRSVIKVYRDGTIFDVYRPVRRKRTFMGGAAYECEQIIGLLNDIMLPPQTTSNKWLIYHIYDWTAYAYNESGKADIFQAPIDYIKSLLVIDSSITDKEYPYNTKFPYLTPSSKIQDNEVRETHEQDGSAGDTYWDYAWRNTGDEVDDLCKALAVLGYYGNTYTPPTKYSGKYYYDSKVVFAFFNDHFPDAHYSGNFWPWTYLPQPDTYNALLKAVQDLINAGEASVDDTGDLQPTYWPVEISNSTVSSDEYKETKAAIEITDYIGVWDAIQTYLVGEYGGVVYPHWNAGDDGKCYLRYQKLDDLYASGQTIEFGENMADLFIDTDMTERYSAVIPIGKDSEGNDVTIAGYMGNSRYFLIDKTAYNKIGRKEIKIEYPDATTPAELYIEAQKWVTENRNKLKDVITVSAYDLKYAGIADGYLEWMTNVGVRSELHGIDDVLPLTACTIALDKPAANKYELGSDPASLVDQIKGE